MTLYTLVGIPGSGKSTRARELAAEKNCVIVSSDDIRAELYGDASEQGNAKEVFGLAYERIRTNLEEGRDVIFDATNISKAKRKKIFNISPKNTVHIAIFFNVPLDVCKERNARRERIVPESVLERMHRYIVPPTTEEGFDIIIEKLF